MIIHRPERFEPEKGSEIREVIRREFGKHDDLVLTDVIFERGPENAEGEAGLVVQSKWRIKGRSYGIKAEWADLPFIALLVESGEIASYVEGVKEKMAEGFNRDEATDDVDVEELVRQDLEELRNPPERNKVGSRIVRDDDLHKRRLQARQENEGDAIMNIHDYLRLRGWVRFFDVEVREEWKRRTEEDGMHRFVGDQGVRYLDPVTGMACDHRTAEGGQLIRDMISVGGTKAYKKIIDENRIP